MSLLQRCGTCAAEPVWYITRVGDVVVTWACDEHLATQCQELQRDHEVTQLIVKLHAKAIEVAEINRSLDAVAREMQPGLDVPPWPGSPWPHGVRERESILYLFVPNPVVPTIGPVERFCGTYWGSHGCCLIPGHEGPHECNCCTCEDHERDHEAEGCVGKPPYYGPDTEFYH